MAGRWKSLNLRLREILRDATLTEAALKVGFALYLLVNRATDDAWPPVSMLQDMTGMTDRGVQRGAAQLVRAGHVKVVRGGGSGKPNRYRLLPVKGDGRVGQTVTGQSLFDQTPTRRSENPDLFHVKTPTDGSPESYMNPGRILGARVTGNDTANQDQQRTPASNGEHEMSVIIEKVEVFLKKELAGGPVTFLEVHRRARCEGIDANDLERGKKRLGVKVSQGPVLEWSLPAS